MEPDPTRRRTLRVLGLAGLTGLAGCTGAIEEIDSGGGDESDDTGGGDDDSSEGQAEATDDSERDDETATDDSNETESDDPDADDVPAPDDESSDGENGGNGDDTEQDDSDPDTAELIVRVVDDADSPIEGASLTLVPHLEGVDAPDHPIEHGETDGEGIYTDVLEHHEYTIEVEHPDYEFGVREYTHDGPGELTVPLKLAGDPETTDVADVSITVVDSAGDPIERASITLIPEVSDRPITEGETDGEGIYTEPIVEQVYVLEIDHAEYEQYRRPYIHEGATEMTIELVDDAEEPSFTLTVTDEDGAPIEGAAVTLAPYVEVGEGASGETDSDGIYTASLDEIDYTIHVTHPDYEDEAMVLGFPRNADFRIELEARRERAELTVIVVDSETEPVEGALVTLIRPDEDPVYDSVTTGETDADGLFTETVREDPYFVEVTHDDYERTEVSHEHVGTSETTVVLEEREG